MDEIQRFYQSFNQDIDTLQLSNEEGGTKEQAFTQLAVEILSDAGVTDNYTIAYEEYGIGTMPLDKQLKINGYAIAENYEQVDLFVSIYHNTLEIINVTKETIKTAAKQVTNFFRESVYGDYAKHIAESSEVLDFAHSLHTYEELRTSLVRINVYILTNGSCKYDKLPDKDISNVKINYNIIDIKYLYEISKNAHSPIEIDFSQEGTALPPCLKIDTDEKSDYEAYIAVFSGSCLYDLYERYGSRLFEQNVRSFLQFSGKINKGIKNTIMKCPEMFLAYNNGISATANSIELDETGHYISKINDLQIVNGGQTTATIYYAYKDTKRRNLRPDLSKISVQAKISVIRDSEKFNTIVSNISKYSNTQNKVNDADFSANNESLIKVEKWSRSILTPTTETSNFRTYWYFERARSQYKTEERLKGFSQAKKKEFMLKYPRKQLFTKEALAKFINAYGEVYDGKKLVVGPHNVAKGGQSNFNQFVNYNLPKENKINAAMYEDIIAKAIIFLTADEMYGTKRSKKPAIGDLKNATVPYTISLLTHLLEIQNRELNLYKIWQNQALSQNLSTLLYSLMKQVNNKIIEISRPDTNFTEKAKKLETWEKVRDYTEWEVNLDSIENDLIDPNNPPARTSTEPSEQQTNDEDLDLIKSIPYSLWKEIAEWGADTGFLDINKKTTAENIYNDLKYGHKLKPREITSGKKIFDIVFENNYELLQKSDEFRRQQEEEASKTRFTNVRPINYKITVGLIKDMLDWESYHKCLQEYKLKPMQYVANNQIILDDTLREKFREYLELLISKGFRPKR